MTQITAQEAAEAMVDLVWGKVSGADGRVGRAVQEQHRDELKRITEAMVKAKSNGNIDKAALAQLIAADSTLIKDLQTVVTDLHTQNLASKVGEKQTYRDEVANNAKLARVLDPTLAVSGAGGSSSGSSTSTTTPGATNGAGGTAGETSETQGAGTNGSEGGAATTPGTGMQLTPEQRRILTEIGLSEEQINRMMNGTDYASVRDKILADIKQAQEDMTKITGDDFKAKQEHLKVYDKLIDNLFDSLKNLNKSEADEIKAKAKERVNAIRDQRKIWNEQQKAVDYVIKIFEKDAKDQFGDTIKAREEAQKDIDRLQDKVDSNDKRIADRIADINGEIRRLEEQIQKLQLKNDQQWERIGRQGGSRGLFGAINQIRRGSPNNARDQKELQTQIDNLRFEQEVLDRELNSPDSTSTLTLEDRKKLTDNAARLLEERRQFTRDLQEAQGKINNNSSEPKDMNEAILVVARKYCADRGINVEGKDLKQLAWELYNTGMFSNN